MRTSIRLALVLTCVILLSDSMLVAQDITATQLIQGYQPRHAADIVETPAPADLARCTRKVVKEGQGSGWVVYGPAGQVLRRYSDTDGDGNVDQFRYYSLGVEVYRDIDSNANEAIDQHRWLNTGGTRWGLDTNEDGRIDSWKRISAQEAVQVAVTAMIDGNADLLSTVLLSDADMTTLRLNTDVADRLRKAVASPAEKMRTAASRSRMLSRGAKWLRFDAQSPGLIPAGSVADRDLILFQNAMAIVEAGGQSGLVHVGEVVQVGDNWKLARIPEPSGNGQIASVSILMQPEVMNSGQPAGAGTPTTPEMQALLEELQTLDKSSPGPTDGMRAIARYNQRRVGLLAKLAKRSPTSEGRDEWTRQLADGIAAAVQTPGGWADGLTMLKQLDGEIAADAGRNKTPIRPYVEYRRMLAEYATRLQTEDVDQRQAAQEWWLDQLPDFARRYPTAPDTADALIELAKNQEFLGKIDEAEKWYRQVAARHPQTAGGKLAAGALRRLGLPGRNLVLSGKDFQQRRVDISQYRGKVVLVAFWSTWCRPCTQELPALIQLHQKHQRAGFEVLGVNLDDPNAPVQAYLQKYKPRWNHINDGGGMQGPIAQQYGIISLPTMFLVDRTGKVLARNVSVAELTDALPRVLQGLPLSPGRPGAAPPAAPSRTSQKPRNP